MQLFTKSTLKAKSAINFFWVVPKDQFHNCFVETAKKIYLEQKEKCLIRKAIN